MATGIFSTYRQGENRITSTLLAVLERLGLDKMERLLSTLVGDDTFRLVRFENQVSMALSVPDARIAAGCSILVEAKSSRDNVSAEQIARHVQGMTEADLLVVLTPDWERPKVLDSPLESRVIWTSYKALQETIEGLLDDKREPPTEREAFLLRQLLLFFDQEGLLDDPEDLVLLLPASKAWPEYLEYSTYVCQPRRSFKKVKRVAFYSEGRIHSLIPRIVATLEEVELSQAGVACLETEPDKAAERELLKSFVERLAESNPARLGTTQKILWLTPSDEVADRLPHDIENDLPYAFVQNQRYLKFSALLHPPALLKTSELLERNQP